MLCTLYSIFRLHSPVTLLYVKNRERLPPIIEELKTYNYKYIDDMNSCLYFSMENGAKLFNKYQEICEKYQNIWNKRAKEKKKEELEQQLKDLDKVD